MFDDAPRPATHLSPSHRPNRQNSTSGSSLSHHLQSLCQAWCPDNVYREFWDSGVTADSDVKSDRSDSDMKQNYTFLQAAYVTFITGDLKEDLKEFGVQVRNL